MRALSLARYMSQVTLQDIANKIGAPPNKIEEYAYVKAREYRARSFSLFPVLPHCPLPPQ
jgi:hypothetical protein